MAHTVSLHDAEPGHTRGVDTAGVTRKTLALLALLALALPVAGVSAPRTGDGTLSVEDGRGAVTVRAKGGVIGKLESGTVTIYDLSPDDAYDQKVFGDDRPVRFVGENGIRYTGNGLRFRLVGGQFRIVIVGTGIDLSVVGRGAGVILGLGGESGVYSLDGADCRTAPADCRPLPDTARRFQLGAPDRERGGKSPNG